MREIEGYPAPSPNTVRSPVARLTWTQANGATAEVPLTGVKTRQSLGTGLPSQVVGVDDLVAADGTASWPVGANVVSAGLVWPWGRKDLPTPGQTVTVDLGVAGEPGPVYARTLTGRIDGKDPASVRERTVSVKLIDGIDRLDRPFSMGPLYYRHPSPTPGEWFMDIGLHPAFMTDRIVRRCGFTATPPTWGRSFVSLTLQGSLWPERGRLQSGEAHPSNVPSPGWRQTQPVFTTTAWGMGLLNGQAILTPDVPTGNPWSRTRPTFFHWLFGPTRGTGNHRFKLTFSNGAAFTVWQTTARIDVIAHGVDDSVINTKTFNMPAETTDRDNEASVWIDLDGTLRVQINNNPPAQAVSFTAPTGEATINQVAVEASTNHMWVAGFQAGFAGQADLHDWQRTSILEVSNQQDQQLANIPAITESNCLSMLRQQANSELAAMWLDQWGRFRYRSRQRLMEAAPVGVLPLSHVHDLQWSVEGGAVREQVHVTFRRPRVQRSVWRNATAYESGSITVEPGDMVEQLIHTPADVDWIGIGPMKVLDDTNDEKLFNWGRDSWISGVIEYEDENTPDVSGATYLRAYANMEQVDFRTWVLTVDGANLPPGSRLVLKSPEWSGLSEARRGVSTPILRAEVVTKWADETVIGTPFGPANIGMLTRDAGFFIQNTTFALQIANQIATYTDAPLPVATGVRVPFDDRREIGDWWTIPGGTNLDGTIRPTMDALIVGIENNYKAAPAKREQILTLQAKRGA